MGRMPISELFDHRLGKIMPRITRKGLTYFHKGSLSIDAFKLKFHPAKYEATRMSTKGTSPKYFERKGRILESNAGCEDIVEILDVYQGYDAEVCCYQSTDGDKLSGDDYWNWRDTLAQNRANGVVE